MIHNTTNCTQRTRHKCSIMSDSLAFNSRISVIPGVIVAQLQFNIQWMHTVCHCSQEVINGKLGFAHVAANVAATTHTQIFVVYRTLSSALSWINRISPSTSTQYEQRNGKCHSQTNFSSRRHVRVPCRVFRAILRECTSACAHVVSSVSPQILKQAFCRWVRHSSVGWCQNAICNSINKLPIVMDTM